jgi:photosystem II stability/assembly factor-like uncharacterized protein
MQSPTLPSRCRVPRRPGARNPSNHGRAITAALVIATATAWAVSARALEPLSYATKPVAFPHDTGSWKKPLRDKAAELEQLVLEHHWIDGLYPSQVTVTDGHADFTTAGHADVSHAINWTTHYLEGQILRWKLTKDPKVYDHVKQVFLAIHRCHEINGVPGLISRGYVLGHGPTYEERRGHGRGQERWFQGKGPYAKYRWRGSPSHHNHSGFFRAMALGRIHLWDDPEIREIVQQDCEAVGQRVFIENDMAVKDVAGRTVAHLMEYGPKDRPSMPGLFVTSELKILSMVTGDPGLTRRYEQMIGDLKYREYARRPVADLVKAIRGNDHDDADHCFSHLDSMKYLETDPELIEFYKKFAEALWTVHKDEKQPIYNITYAFVMGNDGRKQDVLWWLLSYPTIKVFQPQWHSISPESGQLPKPLPMYMRPFDNEYEFKSNPYRMDGWLARIVTNVSVSPADPMVLYATDSGGKLYRSYDGGASWADSFRTLPDHWFNVVLTSSEEVEIVLAGTDKGLYRSRDGGLSWTRVLEGNTTALAADTARPGVACAIVGDAFYESVPFDSESWGYTWKPSGGYGPPGAITARFLIPSGGGVRFLAQDWRGTLWSSAPGRDAWERLARPWGGRYPFTRVTGYGNRCLAATSRPGVIALSTDGGQTWRPRGARYRGQGGGLEGMDVASLAVDPADPQVLYVGGPRTLKISRDGGGTWTASTNGLRIAHVMALNASPIDGAVYAGTAAGLFKSTDRGQTWQPTGLVPIFDGVQLIETGPMDYLTSYWMARYHGFVTEEQATAPWDDLWPSVN